MLSCRRFGSIHAASLHAQHAQALESSIGLSIGVQTGRDMHFTDWVLLSRDVLPAEQTSPALYTDILTTASLMWTSC